MGWNIGANDTANCIGTSVGCGLIPFKRAAILIAVFAILGALLQGHHVMQTIGKGIVKEELNLVAVLVALICSGFFVTLATFFKIPTSTSQAVVGGVLGIGLSVGAKVDFSKFIVIIESWVICPVLVMALALALSQLIGVILHKIRRGSILFQHALGWMAILSGCYVAFSMGANNAGNAVGPIANLGVVNPTLLLFIGGGIYGNGGDYLWEKGCGYHWQSDSSSRCARRLCRASLRCHWDAPLLDPRNSGLNIFGHCGGCGWCWPRKGR